MEGCKELRRVSEICIARSLVVLKAGQTPIRVANFSDKPLRLNPDIPIAGYQPISCANGSVIPTKVDPTSITSCSAIDGTEGRNKQANQARENWMGAVEPDFKRLLPDQKEQFSSLIKEYENIFAVSSFDLGKNRSNGSRSLNDHGKNYCATRLEMLALVTYIDHFRYYFYYLLGRRFRVRTDHHSLTWLMSFKEPQGQVARWLERLQEYDYEVTHRPGKQYCNADALSRRPRRNHGECPSYVPSVNSQVTAVTGTSQTGQGGEGEGPLTQDAIAQAQREDLISAQS